MCLSPRLAVMAALMLLASEGVQADPLYNQANLASDLSTEGAPIVDPNLHNAWGMSLSGNSPIWVSNSGTNTAELFTDPNGTPTKVNLVITTPAAGSPRGGPSGQVNVPAGSGFNIPAQAGGTVPAAFIFANQNGTISAWNPGSVGGMNPGVPGTGTSETVIDNGAGANHASYTGLAIANNGGNTLLYAANTAANAVEVYNSSFAKTSLAGTFTDPNAIAGYSAYNVQAVGTNLFVTYGDNAAGHGTGGYVDEFALNGNFIRRIATNDTLHGPSNGTINDPWGVALAPANFGKFGGDLLIGDLLDSKINAYNISGGHARLRRADPGQYGDLDAVRPVGHRVRQRRDGPLQHPLLHRRDQRLCRRPLRRHHGGARARLGRASRARPDRRARRLRVAATAAPQGGGPHPDRAVMDRWFAC